MALGHVVCSAEEATSGTELVVSPKLRKDKLKTKGKNRAGMNQKTPLVYLLFGWVIVGVFTTSGGRVSLVHQFVKDRFIL